MSVAVRADGKGRRVGAGSRAAVAVLGLGVCCLPACGGEPQHPEAVVHRLAPLVEVVEAEGSAPAAEAGGVLVQAPGALTWYFPIPEDAWLRGSVARRGDGEGEVRVELQPASGERQPLWSRRLADLEGVADLALDLSAAGGGMAGLRLALEADTEDAALAWRDLRIVAPRREPPRVDLPRRDYNVLLVLFDTLRADRTEPYGSTRVRTPEMAALAARGVTFARARANASWTAPSLASILTGTYPSRHGVRGSGLLGALSEMSTLAESLPYLPELLRDRGYATVAVLNNVMVSPRFGFGRGFDAAHEYFLSREEILAQQLSPQQQADGVWSDYFEPVLRERAGAPFFFFLHEIDPHHPYRVPPPFDSMYGDFPDVEPDLFDSLKVHIRYMRDPSSVSPRQVEYMLAGYAAEVTFMDGYLGRLLDRLEEANLRRDTLVVFLSDHGESLTQHQRLGHGDTLYDEVLRVPLILSLPGVLPEGRRVEAPVQLVDLVPTVLDLLGVEPPPTVQGRSLVAELDGASALPERPGFAQARFGGRFALDSVRFRGWKLIQGRRADGEIRLELYDLRSDPGELRNLWEERPVVGRTLRQMLAWRIHSDAKARAESETIRLDAVDPETRENLEALGYLE